MKLRLTNYSACRAAASVPCLQGFIVSAFSEVIRALHLIFQQLK